MGLAGAVSAVQVLSDGVRPGDEALLAVFAHAGVRGVRRIRRQDEDRTRLVGGSHKCDDLRARACEVDIADVESVAEGWVIVEDTVDLGAFGAVVAGFGAIDEIVTEEEEDIAFHGGQGSKLSAERRWLRIGKEKEPSPRQRIAVRNQGRELKASLRARQNRCRD